MPHRLLLVHPHPDDESISCGGLAARSLRDGHDVMIVTCTGGEEGENQSGIDLGGRAMADVRRDEMADAIAALGHPEHHWLGYRDSGMAGEDANDHPDSFHAADVDEAAGRLASIIRRFRPHVVVSDDADGTYGHPDHVKAHAVTSRAVELALDAGFDDGAEPWTVPKRYVFTISRERMWRLHERLVAAGLPSPWEGEEDVPTGPDELPFGSPEDAVTTVVDVRDVLEVKRAAMAAHRSQIGADSFFLNTPPELDDDAFADEELILLSSTLPVTGPEQDVFEGLPS